MGQVTSRLTRPIRNFNIENRVAKALNKSEQTAKAAPKYATTKEEITQFQQNHPEVLEELSQKHELLNENLKKVYVESKGNVPEIKSARPLPLERGAHPETDLGVMDVEGTEIVPEGRATLHTVLGFLGQHQQSPEEMPAAKIAKDFGLKEEDVQNVLANFKVLQLHLPKEMYEENKKLDAIIKEQFKQASGLNSSFRLPGEKPKTVELPDLTEKKV